MSLDRCGECRFYLPHVSFPDRGYCRRFPPPGLMHPVTYASGWCGEHQMIETPVFKHDQVVISSPVQPEPEAPVPLRKHSAQRRRNKIVESTEE
jgi:hypothetical protein